MRKLIFDECWFPCMGPLDTPCHIWTRGTAGNGYGTIRFEGKHVGAHVYAWIIEHGEIPKGQFICYDCDKPLCVNEVHLYLGTPRSNMDDKMKRGRHVGYNKSGGKQPERGYRYDIPRQNR